MNIKDLNLNVDHPLKCGKKKLNTLCIRVNVISSTKISKKKSFLQGVSEKVTDSKYKYFQELQFKFQQILIIVKV